MRLRTWAAQTSNIGGQMQHVVVDVETDGLLPTLSKIWCLVLRDVETAEVLSCTDHAPAEWYTAAPGRARLHTGLERLASAVKLYFHNGIKFDVPALQKVYPQLQLNRETIRDTMVIAQMRWAHIADQDYARAKAGKMPVRLAGSHKLEAWGHRLGVHKGEYQEWCAQQGIDPWGQWRPEMQTYCEGDTDVTRQLVLHIRQAGVSTESMEIEHDLAWYLAQQERNGYPFDMHAACGLHARLSQRRTELADALRQQFGTWLKPGPVMTPKRDNRKKGIVAGASYCKMVEVEFNPGSRDHIADRLQKVFGWKPTEFTDSGKPKVDSETLGALVEKVPAVAQIAEYLLVEKRIGQIAEGNEAWLRHAEPCAITGMTHIHGRVKQNHAVTHRCAHSNPNLAQVPAVGAPYGVECRSLFRVPTGWQQLGADVSGLELRCLAHYMAKYDDGAYARILLEGDIHSANRDALGLEGKEGRSLAKRWVYGLLYGAGDVLLGAVVYPNATPEQQAKEGKRLRALFLKNLPALGALIADVKAAAKSKGWLRMPDGRRTYIRSEHAALNSLLQGSGAIICKRWVVEMDRRFTQEFGPQGWRNGQWAALAFVHDEVQLAVRPKVAERAGVIAVESIRSVGQHFNWRLPLDGEAKLGANWADCH